MSENEIYLTEKQVAELLPGVTASKLRWLRYAGGGPIFSKPSPRTVIYLKSDVDEWIRAGRNTRTDRPVSS